MNWSLVLIIFIVVSCVNQKPEIKSWFYQLQNYNMDTLYKVKDSYVVIDYSKTGAEDARFSNKEIKKIQGYNNKVFAYMSIGEAESYRFYFKTMNKSLLLAENTTWKENYLVKYWENEWLEIIVKNQTEQSYLDRILNTGFDGVYLDLVDAFDRFPDKKKKAENMASLIRRISAHAKKVNPDFKVIIQNGIHIIDYLDDVGVFMHAIDGISLEGAFFWGSLPMNNKLQNTENLFRLIDFYRKSEKILLSVEYLDNPVLLDQYNQLVKSQKLMPLVRRRLLD